MKKTLPKAILIIAAIFLLTACQQKPTAISNGPAATNGTQQATTSLPQEKTGQKTSKSLDDCTDEDCFYDLITRDQASSYTFEDCKNLDGKIADDTFKADLGMLCRLVVSRNKASFRQTDPCNNSGFNPDYDFDLNPEISLNMYVTGLQEQLLKQYGIGEPESLGGSTSTIYGTYRSTMDTREKEGQERSYSFSTYFCLTGNPVHYTPYFYVVGLSDASGTESIAGMDYIETPPVLDPVFSQFENNRDGIAEFKNEGFRLPGGYELKNSILLADFDEDGNKDLLIIYENFFDDYYLPVICFYDKESDICTLKRALQNLPQPEMSSSDISSSITTLDDNRFKLQILDPRKKDAVVAESTYQYANGELAQFKKVKRQ